jgi:hypothetical protein
MIENQFDSQAEPLTKWRRLLEVNELRARDAEARLRYILAEARIREVSEKLVYARKARTVQGLNDKNSPEVLPTSEVSTKASARSEATDGEKSQAARRKSIGIWPWIKGARKRNKTITS